MDYQECQYSCKSGSNNNDNNNTRNIESLNEGDWYKCLGVIEADEIKKKEMKEKVGKEYKRRIRKILETKLWREYYKREQCTWAIYFLTKILRCIS